LVIALFSSHALGAVVAADWTTFTPSSSSGAGNGTATGTLSYSGTIINLSYLGDVFGTSTFINGTATAFNTPLFTNPGQIAATDAIACDGGVGKVHTINFSQPIANPIMYIYSLGNGITGLTPDWTFTSAFTLLSAQNLSNPSGNVLRGTEGHGAIRFTGTISQIKWTSSIFENVTFFQVGVVVPETSSACLTLLSSVLLLHRSRR
jgi:hypothetical protein